MDAQNSQTSLIDELALYGEVRNKGCILRIEGEYYVMENGRDLMLPKHKLACSQTSADRLEAHWAGFVANVKLSRDVPGARRLP